MALPRMILLLALAGLVACAPAAPAAPTSAPPKPTTPASTGSATAPAQPTTPPAKPAGKAAAPTSPASTGSTTAPAAQPAAKPTVDDALQKDWNDLIAKAKSEGELVVISSTATVSDERKIYDLFGQKFGIKITLSGGGAEVANRYLAERAQGLSLVDVHSLSTSGVLRLLDGGGFMTPMLPQIIHPEVLDRSTGFWVKGWPWGDPQNAFITHYAVVADVNALKLYYNTQGVQQAEAGQLRSWNDLVQSKYRIVMLDPREDVGASERIAGWMLPSIGRPFFERLLQRPNLTVLPGSSSRQLIDGLARGEWDFAMFPGPAEQGIVEAGTIGLPIAVFPHTFAEGPTAETTRNLGIMADPPHPNVAKLFVNWYLSRDGGTTYNQLNERPGRAHIRADVPQGNVDSETWDRLQKATVVLRTDEYYKADEQSLKWFQEKFKELGISVAP